MEKLHKLGKTSFYKTSFQLGVDPSGTETRQRWKNARRLLNIRKNTQQMYSRVVFSRSVISVLFSGSSLIEMNFYTSFFLSLCYFRGVSKPPSKQKMNKLILLETNTFSAGGRTCFVLVTNALVLEMNALKTCIQTSPEHTQLAIATSDFQTELISRWLLLTGTHVRKQAVVTMLLYSPPSMLHPQVIYAIAFSAWLNGQQVDKVDKEND